MSCTADSLSQGITSGHCIPKELPSEPASSPSGPSTPTNKLMTGRPPAHITHLGHLLQLLGPGLGRRLLSPPPTEGRVPPGVSKRTSSFPHFLSDLPHSKRPSLCQKPFHCP